MDTEGRTVLDAKELKIENDSPFSIIRCPPKRIYMDEQDSGTYETVQETLARLRWRKTQPPKSPLVRGTCHSFPPDKGG